MSTSAVGTRVAVGQIGAALGDIPANLASCIATQVSAADRGVDLLVLPECALSGYVHASREAAAAASIGIDGPELTAVAETCARLNQHVVVGFVEQAGERLFNAGALLGPDGVVASYRKAHLPYLGVDRFLDHGDGAGPIVAETRFGRIGLAICYDLRFPESARSLALAGADLIAQPSNWPFQARMLAEHFVRVRACENRVFIVVANRPDTERGVDFMGMSQIVNPDGEVLAAAQRETGLVFADVDLAAARHKSIITKPGEYQVSLFADRRPELYQVLTQPRRIEPKG